MKRIAPHVGLATLLRISNVWLFDDGQGRRFLVDTGHPLERATLKFSLWRAGIRRKGDLAGVILTHRHSDHAGNAAWLRRTFDCPVACHADDASVLRGDSPPPRLARGIGRLHEEVLAGIEDRFPARSPVDEELEAGRWKWGFRVVHVPGHTKGSILLHHEPTRTLFAGDAILSGIPPFRFWEWPRLAVHGFSDEVTECHRHVLGFLRDLPPTELLCSGHGPPIASETQEKLTRLGERISGVLPVPA